jgi:hypothetical protein
MSFDDAVVVSSLLRLTAFGVDDSSPEGRPRLEVVRTGIVALDNTSATLDLNSCRDSNFDATLLSAATVRR